MTTRYRFGQNDFYAYNHPELGLIYVNEQQYKELTEPTYEGFLNWFNKNRVNYTLKLLTNTTDEVYLIGAGSLDELYVFNYSKGGNSGRYRNLMAFWTFINSAHSLPYYKVKEMQIHE
jgi:hypothetical protein